MTSRSYVFYGRSGTGKTTLGATFPKPILLLDANDQGTDSIADIEEIEVMDIKSWDDFEMAYWYLVQHPDEFATVLVDTVSMVQNLAIKRVLEDKNKDPESAGQWGAMAKGDWGTVASMMKEYIDRYRDLDIETVFVAQDRTFNLDDDVDPEQQLDPEVGPQLMPSVCKHLNAAVQVIGNTFTRERFIRRKVKGKIKETSKIEFCLRVGPNPEYITKVRKPKAVKLPSVIVDPTYGDLRDIIKGVV